jgi:glycerol-3-phosphate O-acyltransferase
MFISEITVQSQISYVNPNEDFGNFRPSVTLRARLQEGEDPVRAARKLQRIADVHLEEHREMTLERLAAEKEGGKNVR